MTQKKPITQFAIINTLDKAMDSEDLTDKEHHLLLTIWLCTGNNGMSQPSYNTLIKKTRLSRPTIASTIKNLVDKEWISYEKGSNVRGRCNIYQINLEKIGYKTKQDDKQEIQHPVHQHTQVQVSAKNQKKFDEIARMIRQSRIKQEQEYWYEV